MMEPWVDDLSVGNAAIDADHQKLIVMVNEVEAMIRARCGKALPQALEQLEQHLQIHFVREEKIARAVNFPFGANRMGHEYVLKEFQHMKNELIAREGIWSDGAAEHYSHFLSDWITDHVLNEDMLLKPVLQTYPYGFDPT
ncbi:MAG: hypothetical protein A3F73_00840 [Gallionellales bacterium RIFCSPLOWO2_12_FULL_59_22]|nr:MAG: hypothetical protein A3H99_05875 [Gallionellales bacterium RIFCSPLOWO2_02_FULL_59_110]OGT02585.1 MAG: hypothetical protein A2Z65_10750 [Gallionellales bacterium RIFCSPLOWO2_02_58_13]OGT11219.1 MAG: hypothetical protein A3F73_00840 [Gallionellales bacterium RIFCSPLOWO2_12_FULL_59_22]